MNWIIELNGDDEILKMLAKSCCNSSFKISEVDGNYQLEVDWLNNYENVKDVKFNSEEIVQSLNGALKLSVNNDVPVAITGYHYIEEDGHKKTFVFIEEIIRIRDGISISILHKGEEQIVFSPMDSIPDWISCSVNNEEVKKVLRLFFSDGHTWAGMYKIFEIIKKDMGNLDKLECITKSSQNRFKMSANSVVAAGDDSRHGIDNGTNPRNPMSISEAKSLINQLIYNWLAAKI